jgi:hypothetical protein
MHVIPPTNRGSTYETIFFNMGKGTYHKTLYWIISDARSVHILGRTTQKVRTQQLKLKEIRNSRLGGVMKQG